MTETHYLEQAEKDRLELEQHRLNYMADDTPIEPSDIPKLMEIAKKLRAEDTSLNIYGLYKHPEARAKLFSQITEACYMALSATPTQAQRVDHREPSSWQNLAIHRESAGVRNPV